MLNEKAKKVVSMSSAKKKYLLVFSFIIIAIFISGKFIYQPFKRNVILIVVDALRPDHLGCYGYQRNTSPNIDNLAKEAVLFAQAISQGTMTSVSVPSILTSTYRHTHGVRNYGDHLNPSIVTIAQVLKDYGYFTGLISEHGTLHTLRGLERGFDTFEGRGLDTFREKASSITACVIDWLKNNRNKPFFLYLHYMSVHHPYCPPSPYDRMFLTDRSRKEDKEVLKIKYQWIITQEDIGQGPQILPKPLVEGNLTKEDIDYYISQYDGGVRFTDEKIGVLLGELKRLNLEKETIVILTADHGENLCEYDLEFGHGNPQDVVLKVPLIIKDSNLIPQGKVIAQQIQSIDIMPTILDILNIKKPKTAEGISLLPLILKGKEYPTPHIFTNDGDCGIIRTEEWKLICDGDNYELYNLKKDPQEFNNVIEMEKEKFAFLKEKLDNWKRQAKPRRHKKTQPLTEEEKERLRSLGYLQ